MIQGPSMPAPLPYTMLLPTHNITLSRKMVISRNSLSNVICRATVCLGNMYFSATHIFWPKETAFRCIGENEAFWVNATWLKCTLFEKKLMAFVWLWARPDFLHFFLDLLVISHVTTILPQYCAWRWREGKYTWKSINITVSYTLY